MGGQGAWLVGGLGRALSLLFHFHGLCTRQSIRPSSHTRVWFADTNEMSGTGLLSHARVWFAGKMSGEAPDAGTSKALSTPKGPPKTSSQVSPTLTERPNRRFSDLRFTLPDPPNPRVCKGGMTPPKNRSFREGWNQTLTGSQ